MTIHNSSFQCVSISKIVFIVACYLLLVEARMCVKIVVILKLFPSNIFKYKCVHEIKKQVRTEITEKLLPIEGGAYIKMLNFVNVNIRRPKHRGGGGAIESIDPTKKSKICSY